MLNILISWYLTFSCLFVTGFCLDFTATELALYTGFTAQGLDMFFSVLSPSKTKYCILLRIFSSRKFDFRAYSTIAATLEELNFISNEYELIPMLYVTQIYQLQGTRHRREWLLKNLDKLKNTNLALYYMKPSLFTLEEQQTILTFSMAHHSYFMQRQHFCTIFSDMTVFDHEQLWLYLDPYCLWRLAKHLYQQAVGILQKNARKKAGHIAVLFLILVREPIEDWKSVDIEQAELKDLLQKYEKALGENACPDKLWQFYNSLVPLFKNLPPNGNLPALSHFWLLLYNLPLKNELQAHKELEKFMAIHQPNELAHYLVIAMCDRLSKLNKSWHQKFKLPPAWKREILNSYTRFMAMDNLPHELRSQGWRNHVMKLTPDQLSETRDDEKHVYPNDTIDGTLSVHYYIKEIGQLIDEEYLKVEPVLKFDCKRLKEKRHIIFKLWRARIYQLAIYGTSLPLLNKLFENAIITQETEIDHYKESFKGLADAICLYPNDAPLDTVKDIIGRTRETLGRFNLAFYYDRQDEITIF